MKGPVVRRLSLGPMANFVYLIGDGASRECAVVDPAWDVPAILEEAEAREWRISLILLTHAHPDHSNGVRRLLDAAEVPLVVHREDAGAFEGVPGLRPVEDGERLPLGSVTVRAIHTPGHTPGSQCFLAGNELLTGDTLFVEGCGRSDLPGSDPVKLHGSLLKLAELPPATVIHPGHDYGSEPTSTVRLERERNACIRAAMKTSAREFASLMG